MRVELVSPERAVWTGEATYVGARTVAGGIGIYANHEPMLATLDAGIVKITAENGSEVLAAVAGGFMSVTSEGVSLLAEVAELQGEVDVQAAQRDLSETEGADPHDGEAGLRRRGAQARLELAGQGGSSAGSPRPGA